MFERLVIRVHGPAELPALIYLPGLHGDWTLAGNFRSALGGRLRLVEVTYPRTLEWSLDDYARAVVGELLAHGITRGWILGESFSSQVAWAMAGLGQQGKKFQIDGIILEGGFVKHPFPWGIWLFRVANRLTPIFALRGCLKLFRRYFAVRHCHTPDSQADLCEFVRNRGCPEDRAAMRHRLRLIAGADLRPIARRTTLPVYSLTGSIDPLVPWPLVSRWLARNCPGYRGTRMVRGGRHNLCFSSPQAAADQVVAWIGGHCAPADGGAVARAGRAT